MSYNLGNKLNRVRSYNRPAVKWTFLIFAVIGLALAMLFFIAGLFAGIDNKSFDGYYKNIYYDIVKSKDGETEEIAIRKVEMTGDVVIPESIRGKKVTQIGVDQTYTLANEKGQIIGSYYRVFTNAESITSVVLPDTITVIGKRAFYECKSLKIIHYNGTKEQWRAIPKGDRWDSDADDYTVYCTDGELKKGV